MRRGLCLLFIGGLMLVASPPAWAQDAKGKADKPAAKAGKEAKPTAAAGALQVEVKLARELSERKPVDPGNAFAPGKLYCWNDIRGGEGDFAVTHLWYRDGKQVWKRAVRAKGKKWVTWSFHNVTAGSWKVEVTDAGGVVLQTAEFTVK